MTRPTLTGLPILRTERLLLRWFTPADAEFVRRLLNDPGWLRNIGDRGVRTRGQAAAWIGARLVEPYGRLGFGFWAMERLSDGKRIGLCGLIKRDTLDDVDLGFAFLPEFRGQGYAREASLAVLALGERAFSLTRVAGITSPGNAPSIGLLESLGFRFRRVIHLTPDDPGTNLYLRASGAPE